MQLQTALAGIGLAALIGTASTAQADNFYFSFTNDVGNIPGTVTGELFGLTNDATSSATSVEILSYPSDLVPTGESSYYTTPIDAVDWATQVDNSFTVVDDVVVAGEFRADNTTAVSSLDRLFLNDGPCSSGDTCSFLSLGTSDGSYVWHGLGGTTYSLASAAPEPSAWVLLIAGLGGVGLMLRRARNAGLRFHRYFNII